VSRRRIAWILILIVDLAYIAWGAGAAASPDHLLGPGGKAILPAGYEGYSGGSWSELAGASPLVAGYMKVLYRMYGVYNVLFGLMGSVIAVTAFRRGERWAWWALLVGNTVALVSAMTYDKTVNASGRSSCRNTLASPPSGERSPSQLDSVHRDGRFQRLADTFRAAAPAART
jgi:hypothetical protein